MTKTRTRFVPIMMVVTLFLVADSVAQDPTPPESGQPASLDLLDRGSTADGLTKAPGMMATLAVGSATPGLTMVSVVGFASMLPAPAFYGNVYGAPVDFPTSWYPFAVTGVFAWHSFPPFPPASLVLGAGVAPGPFSGGMGTMWHAFGTAMVPVPMFMTPAVIGMPGNLAPPLSVPMTPMSLKVACGLGTSPLPTGPLLGAIVPPASPRDAQSINGPPLGPDVLVPPPPIGLFVQWVAGCYVSGATVPVELQSFHVE